MAENSKKMGIAIIAVPIIAIVLLVAGIIIYTQSAFAAIPKAPVQVSGPISFNVSLVSSGVATYSNAQLLVPYAVARYTSANLSEIELFLDVYTKNPLPNIYYLNTTNYCYHCYSDLAVFSNVSIYLRKYGVIGATNRLFYINPSQLSSVPAGSTIIVPSGLLPVYMLPQSGFQLSGSENLLTLINNSDTILYIGDNFSRSSGPGGVIFSSSNATLTAIARIGLDSGPFRNTNLTNNYFDFKNTTFGFRLGGYQYSASYLSTANGSVVSFSNTQKSGWGNSTNVAKDIARAISLHFWMDDIASGSYITTIPGESATIGVPAFASSINNTGGVGRRINASYAVLTAVVGNSADFLERQIPVNLVYASNGTLSLPTYVGQSQSVPIGVSINVNSTTPQLVIPHIDLYDKNLSFVAAIPIPFFNTTSNIDIIKYYSFQIPSGTYIAVLRNFFNKYYSSAIVNVTSVTLTPISLGFANGTFSFLAQSNNFPISNATYSMDLNGAYTYNGVLSGGVITYSLPKGTVIGYGPETFNLHIFNTKYSYVAANTQQVLNIPTIYIEFVIVGLAVLILNLIIKPPNRDEYYIDVPEFQQAKKVNVKINRGEILNVFDKVNFLYHWKYMPLTLEEIKSGVSNNIRYNNIPVSITMQNAALIMSRLIVDGDIVSSGGYYAPKKWMSDSGYDIEYLSVFRRIRDYCVGHALLFTDVGASEAADITLSKSGAQTHIVIYSSLGTMRNIEVAPNFKTYIVFADEEKMLGFTEKLYKSYGNQAEMLKIGISYGYIRLVDANNLDQIVF
ncbi:MAG: hypothetical protein KGH65_01515 [Candidatus Micrarchaeota archaeon]|nr:hypothetical protein [Candidatus Micrarchaeota archaeon]